MNNYVELVCDKEVDWINEDKIIQITTLIMSLMKVSEKTISLLLCDNTAIQELNKNYRDKDYATDVLSFVYEEEEIIGDIAISLDKVVEQANEYGFSNEEEFKRLLIHGILHVLGYDHETNEEDRLIMESKEEELRNHVKDYKLV